MHVCLVTSSRPTEIFYGGEERFTILLRNWLIHHGNVATIVGRKFSGVEVIKPQDALHTEPRTKSTQPYVASLPYIIFALGMLIVSLFSLLQIIATNRKSRISIIHAQDTGYGGLSALLAAKILRVPVIITSHGIRYFTLRNTFSSFSRALLLPFEYWLDNITTKTADVIILPCSSAADFFAKIGVKKSKMTVVPTGLKTENFKVTETVRLETRGEFNAHNNVVIGFVGRLSPEKNLPTLLDAFIKMSKHANKTKLMIIGTGPMEEKLRTTSMDRGMKGKVIFTGARLDVNRLLSAIDIFVLPSYTEGCPMALLEAMAAGKPIVASNIPAIREIVEDKKEALLCDPYSSEHFKDAILKLYSDPRLRKTLSENAKMKSKQYDTCVIFSKMLQVYREILRVHVEKKKKLD